MTKAELRQVIRLAKRQYSQGQLRELSLAIIERLERNERFAKSTILLAYYSLPDEVFTHNLIKKYSKTKTILLPKVINGEEMELRQYIYGSDLMLGAYKIMEPCGEAFNDYDKIEMAIIPGLAFDRNGNRLGRGKGYYDRLLSHMHNTYKVGICFPFQLVDNVPTNENDVKMDFILT